MAKKAAYAKRQQSNLFGLTVSTIVVLTMLIVVSVQSTQLKGKIAEKQDEIVVVQEQIAAQQERAVALEQRSKEVKTKGFIERMARELLGLVYPGEVVFKESR